MDARSAALEVKLEEVKNKNKGFGFVSFENIEFAAHMKVASAAAERAAAEKAAAEKAAFE